MARHEQPKPAMTIHDHFDGMGYCVECGGPCRLDEAGKAVSGFVRFTLECAALRGNCGLNMMQEYALESICGKEYAMRLKHRAKESAKGIPK